MSRLMTSKCSMGRMAGLSLIELMIAMVLGIILTLGVTQVYLGSSQTNRQTKGVAHAQENIRFARSMLARDVRSAGGFGCLLSVDKIGSKLQSKPGFDLDKGLVGREAVGSGVGDSMTASMTLPSDDSGWGDGPNGVDFPEELKEKVIGGTDVLIVNAQRPSSVTINGNDTDEISLDAPSDISLGHNVLVINDDCSRGELFRNGSDQTAESLTMASSGNASVSQFDLDYNADARFIEFNTLAFYVGEGASGEEPALFVQRLDATPENPQELVAGVESMQVLYGVANDINTSASADSYVTADSVTDWGAVVSVRIALLVRSDANANSEEQQRTFNLLGTQLTSPMDRRARLLASMTIGLRNRLE